MAINVPMPDLSGDSFLKGVEGGSSLMNRNAQTQELQNKNMTENLKRNLLNQLMGNGGLTQNPSGNSVNPGAATGGMNLDTLRKNPMIRGLIKSTLGFDPLEGETNVLEGPARDALDLKKLKDQFGEQSEVYQNAKNNYDSSIDAKKDLRDLRARTKAGLKPGETEFFDKDTNVPLGKEVPYTEKERQMEQGNSLFNSLYPVVYKGQAPFSGEGSITRLQNAAANYKTDPKARQLFDDFLLANKAMASTTVNEAATLGTRGTNQTYNMLKASLDAQDIPNVITRLIKEFKIPASAQLTAAMRFQKLLSDARNKATTSVPATRKLYYNPEMQKQYEQKDSAPAQAGSGNKEVLPDGATDKKNVGSTTFYKIKGQWVPALGDQ
jgi:hypothetical protein